MTLAGSFDGTGLRIAVVCARFNDVVTSRLLEGCLTSLKRHGVSAITEAEVAGARELPVACLHMARTGRYDAIIALGCVIRGETVHFDLVVNEASRGCAQASLDTGVPVIFGVLATEDLEQAFQRAGGKVGNAGWDAATTAIETATLIEAIEKSSSC